MGALLTWRRCSSSTNFPNHQRTRWNRSHILVMQCHSMSLKGVCGTSVGMTHVLCRRCTHKAHVSFRGKTDRVISLAPHEGSLHTICSARRVIPRWFFCRLWPRTSLTRTFCVVLIINYDKSKTDRLLALPQHQRDCFSVSHPPCTCMLSERVHARCNLREC